jgi:hypothetical protein
MNVATTNLVGYLDRDTELKWIWDNERADLDRLFIPNLKDVQNLSELADRYREPFFVRFYEDYDRVEILDLNHRVYAQWNYHLGKRFLLRVAFWLNDERYSGKKLTKDDEIELSLKNGDKVPFIYAKKVNGRKLMLAGYRFPEKYTEFVREVYGQSSAREVVQVIEKSFTPESLALMLPVKVNMDSVVVYEEQPADYNLMANALKKKQRLEMDKQPPERKAALSLRHKKEMEQLKKFLSAPEIDPTWRLEIVDEKNRPFSSDCMTFRVMNEWGKYNLARCNDGKLSEPLFKQWYEAIFLPPLFTVTFGDYLSQERTDPNFCYMQKASRIFGKQPRVCYPDKKRRDVVVLCLRRKDYAHDGRWYNHGVADAATGEILLPNLDADHPPSSLWTNRLDNAVMTACGIVGRGLYRRQTLNEGLDWFDTNLDQRRCASCRLGQQKLQKIREIRLDEWRAKERKKEKEEEIRERERRESERHDYDTPSSYSGWRRYSWAGTWPGPHDR